MRITRPQTTAPQLPLLFRWHEIGHERARREQRWIKTQQSQRSQLRGHNQEHGHRHIQDHGHSNGGCHCRPQPRSWTHPRLQPTCKSCSDGRTLGVPQTVNHQSLLSATAVLTRRGRKGNAQTECERNIATKEHNNKKELTF